MKKFSLTAMALATACAVPSFAGMADNAAKFVGNITQSNNVRGDFSTYWNQATAENGCKWQSVEGTRGQYNWGGCDAAYNWAKQSGGHFKFHALVWGSQYPNWLNGLSVDETRKAITAWFDAVKKHYPELEMIDVVNEAIRNGDGSYHSGYGKGNNIIGALGGDNGKYDFVTTAFKMARERWPNAILIYNDYNTIQHSVDGGIDLVNTVRKNGGPIDGYGLQAHDLMTQGGGAGGTGGGGNCMNYNSFKSTMEKIHNQTNNIPIFISEYDVPSTDDAIQEQCVREQVTYWMEDPNVAGITFWGYIYGQTWLSCHNKTVSGCSGLIKDGSERSALVWLKKYLASNTGVNTTGLQTGIVGDPVPQSPFKQTALEIPGKIEAEDFDVPGVGRGNNSYSVASSGHGNSDYREDTGVNLYKNATGVVIGYNNSGNWYEYTVNVKEDGDYTVFAAVASANNTSSFQLSIDEKDITDKIAVPKAESGEENYSDYNKVSADVKLTKGEHILRLTATGDWFDIDYMTFVAKGEKDPEPIVKGTVEVVEPESSAAAVVDPSSSAAGNIPGLDPDGNQQAIKHTLYGNQMVRMDFDVFDMQGKFMGSLSAYTVSGAVSTVQNSSLIKANGIYTLRNHTTGAMHSFRVVR